MQAWIYLFDISLCDISYILNLDIQTVLNVYLKYKLDNVASYTERKLPSKISTGVQHSGMFVLTVTCFIFYIVLL